MDNIATTIMALCALIISIISPIFRVYWSNKLNRVNLTSTYLKEVYGKILYEDLPVAREHIHINNNIIEGCDLLLSVLRDIRKRALYFKSTNKVFYEGIHREIQELENHLFKAGDPMTSEQIAEFLNTTNEYIENIYGYMSDVYLGKYKVT
ncbi:MAG: hypothetical protein FWC09_06510 [Lachnospiraceae bacterium]|nr:hypothetical protein [Lachnospiraceae bacterium]